MNPPNNIVIKSDGNEFKLVQVNKDGTYTYQYTKSKTKKSQMLTLTQEGLIKIIKQNE